MVVYQLILIKTVTVLKTVTEFKRFMWARVFLNRYRSEPLLKKTHEKTKVKAMQIAKGSTKKNGAREREREREREEGCTFGGVFNGRLERFLCLRKVKAAKRWARSSTHEKLLRPCLDGTSLRKISEGSHSSPSSRFGGNCAMEQRRSFDFKGPELWRRGMFIYLGSSKQW